jgi:hypothetical protein
VPLAKSAIEYIHRGTIMTEQEELKRLREVLRAAKSVVDAQSPFIMTNGHAASYYTVPCDRLNWLTDVVRDAVNGGEQHG